MYVSGVFSKKLFCCRKTWINADVKHTSTLGDLVCLYLRQVKKDKQIYFQCKQKINIPNVMCLYFFIYLHTNK